MTWLLSMKNMMSMVTTLKVRNITHYLQCLELKQFWEFCKGEETN